MKPQTHVLIMKTNQFPRQTFFSLKRHGRKIVWQSTQRATWNGKFGTCLKLYFEGANHEEVAKKFYDELMVVLEWNGGKSDENTD